VLRGVVKVVWRDAESEHLVHTHKVWCSLRFLVDRGSGDVLVLFSFLFFSFLFLR
jgi:hypothetical protein